MRSDRTGRQGVFPLLALLVFLNGAVCFCFDHVSGEHGALEHLSAALQQGQDGPARGHQNHAPEEDGCVQMDVLGIRENGVDHEGLLQGSSPVAAIVREPMLSLELAAGLTRGAEPPGMHGPPRFLTHCSLLC